MWWFFFFCCKSAMEVQLNGIFCYALWFGKGNTKNILTFSVFCGSMPRENDLKTTLDLHCLNNLFYMKHHLSVTHV